MALGNPTLVGDDSSRNVSVIANASQTLFNVDGGYQTNKINVYRNGVRLSKGIDYSATDGSSVTLTSGASDGDVLEFQIFGDFIVSNAITTAESQQTITGDLHIEGQLTADRDIFATGVVTATTFYGDGSNLSNISNWGEYEFTATGSIAKGYPVVLNPDGTVSGSGFGYPGDGNYIGMAAELISNGETGPVTICSGINSSQIGLSPGKKYYISPSDGNLKTYPSPGDQKVAGLAISSTEIIVSGKNEFISISDIDPEDPNYPGKPTPQELGCSESQYVRPIYEYKLKNSVSTGFSEYNSIGYPQFEWVPGCFSCNYSGGADLTCTTKFRRKLRHLNLRSPSNTCNIAVFESGFVDCNAQGCFNISSSTCLYAPELWSVILIGWCCCSVGPQDLPVGTLTLPGPGEGRNPAYAP